jgi:hypothetical protein
MFIDAKQCHALGEEKIKFPTTRKCIWMSKARSICMLAQGVKQPTLGLILSSGTHTRATHTAHARDALSTLHRKLGIMKTWH